MNSKPLVGGGGLKSTTYSCMFCSFSKYLVSCLVCMTTLLLINDVLLRNLEFSSYHRFIKGYSKIITPLHILIEKIENSTGMSNSTVHSIVQ